MPKQITKLNPASLLLGFTALLSACLAHSEESGIQKSQSTTQSQSSGKSSAGASSKESAAAVMKLSSEDEKMMFDLARASIIEINEGKLVEKKSENEQVINFAKKMIDDHTKALDELKLLAKDKGVTLPTETDAKQQAMGKKLSNLSGSQFDQQYLDQVGSRAHRQTHQLHKRVSNRAKDADLKSYSSKILPTLESHQNLSKDTRKELQSTSEGRSTGAKEGGSPMKESK